MKIARNSYSVFQKWFFEGARLQPRRPEPYKTWALAPEGKSRLLSGDF
jgi:hypothetical protein